MQIVIDIPEKEYQACVRRDTNMTGNIADSYIAQGTVLSKGHGDLISRNALKKSFSGYTLFTANTVIKHIDNAPTVDVESVKSELNPTVTCWHDFDRGYEKGYERGKSEKSQGEWIPVSERLPEENVCDDGYHEPSKWVLVQARNGHMYTTRYWTRDKKNVWTDLEYPDDIIAWRPLPESYKEGGAE